MSMANNRGNARQRYMPESVPIAETVDRLTKRGKLNLTIKPTQEVLRAQINLKAPESTSKDLKPGDEYDGSVVVLHINEIHPYDRNPRTSPNPKYREIKESIRERRGLKGQLTVTKRPDGKNRYMLYMGGNTRLQILKELFEETGDKAFSQVNCLYHSWKSEADVLASHLIENEARGDTLFVEKARGLIDLMREIERETGQKVTARDVQAKTAAMGMTVNPATVLLYEFAIEHLQPLGAWLTRENVNDIKRRYAQHEVLATNLQLTGNFLADYPREIQRFQSEFAGALESRQAAQKESGETAAIALRGETLRELLRGFDRVLASVLALAPDVSARVSKALDVAGKETLSAAALHALLNGNAGGPENVSIKAKDTEATRPPAATPKTPSRHPVTLLGAPAAGDGSMPAPAATSATASADDAPLSPPLCEPARLDPDEPITPERFNEIGVWFFAKLKAWCELTRIEPWLQSGIDLDLPYLFWLELPEEVAMRGENDVRLDDPADPEFGTLDPAQARIRSSAYRLVALLSGQLGGVIVDERGRFTTESTFAERLPAGSAWRAAATVDYMDVGAFYNLWEAQMGGVTSQTSCQLGLAQHDLLSVLSEPSLAEPWLVLARAYGLWGQALGMWRAQAPTNDQ